METNPNINTSTRSNTVRRVQPFTFLEGGPNAMNPDDRPQSFRDFVNAQKSQVVPNDLVDDIPDERDSGLE